ncbi:MAG: DNA polymerase I [Bacteroidetes bacterium QS_9_68_14]|nr:MAG: DNA polymerase I [Bacteroidetes bacterium QS_9_68_14]
MPETENAAPADSDAEGQAATNQLYLIDAMALAYRAHYIFISRPLINSKGKNTSAAYGFTNMLLKLIEQHDMEHIAVVFDAPSESGGTFREDLYPEYKAHRDPPPEELLDNLPYMKDIVRAMDIPVLEEEGVEADDVIGTLARRAEEDGAEAVIVSADKDFKQLLTEKVSIYKPARGDRDFETITAESFKEEEGFAPPLFADQLALWGDASDNVPGVPLIGEKTSAKLLRKYGDVEDVLSHADDVGGKRGENLTEHADQARLSKELVTIKTDVPVRFDWHELRQQEPNEEVLKQIFEELEFRSFLDRITGEDGGDAGASGDGVAGEDSSVSFDFGPYEEVRAYDAAEVDYEIVTTLDEVRALAEELAETDRFAFDTETTSTDARRAELVGVAFSREEEQGRYVPTPLPQDGGGDDESAGSTGDVLGALAPAFDCEAEKTGHNLKYDLLVLASHGVEVTGPLFDTMVAHYLAAPQDTQTLDAVARKHLSYRAKPIEDLIGDEQEADSMRDVPVEEAAPYACEDADLALRLVGPLTEKLEEDGLMDLAEEAELPLVRVLTEMERRGIEIDREHLAEISEEIAAEMEEIEAKIHEHAGHAFNVNSTQQLAEVLFEEQDLRVVSKTSTGNASTKESVLQELSDEHPIPPLVLEYRSMAKLKGTYLDSLGELVDERTGRLHTSFNQAVTATGRLSSSDPNLQNVPVRTERGRRIRRAFVAAEGWTLMAADYAQIELRILAAMSGDEAMLATFREEGDIHTDAAARVYDVAPADVTRDQRRKAKAVNYGIPYGVSAWGLAQRLADVSREEAEGLIEQYRSSYPAVSRLLAELVEKAKEKGYAETLDGRRRYLPGLTSQNHRQRAFAERAAVNMPIQGTQADMIKIAMVQVHERLAAEDFESRMLLQVHDELVFEVRPREEEAARELVRTEMREALPLEDVPVAVDIDTGPNWLDAH